MTNVRLDWVLGTRPEITKSASIISAIASLQGSAPDLLLTGQQITLVRDALVAMGLESSARYTWLSKPDFSASSLANWHAEARVALMSRWRSTIPDAVVVVGDTASARLGAECGHLFRLPVCHLEAGIRHPVSSAPDIEEENRRVISKLADIHFAPTHVEKENLLRENIAAERIRLIDDLSAAALAYTLTRLPHRALQAATFVEALSYVDGAADIVAPPARYLLSTFHRPSSLAAWGDLAESMKSLARDLSSPPIVLCRRPDTRWTEFYKSLDDCPNVVQVPALPHPIFCLALMFADLVITDSAGVQQEALLLAKTVIATRQQVELYGHHNNLTLVPPPFKELATTCTRLLRATAGSIVVPQRWTPIAKEAAIELIAAIVEVRKNM
jgi:UDP-N-acetylglucosamine 2-epimerase (non-hydrolysing)